MLKSCPKADFINSNRVVFCCWENKTLIKSDIKLTIPFEFARVKTWAVEAGKIALNYYQTQLTHKQKDDLSPVTEADQVVEQFLIKKIRQTYSPSNYSIIAEESGGDWQNKEFTWVIDPIDGTRIFINGLPLWCISIGLLQNGEVYRGVVYLPATNDIFYTNDEGFAFWNNRPLKGSLPPQWNRNSFMAVSSGVHQYFKIDFQRLRALGAIATHHVYVAGGAAIAALHRKTSIWDIAGAHAILTSVGGQAVYLDGSPLTFTEILNTDNKSCKGPILVGHATIIEKLLPKIKAL